MEKEKTALMQAIEKYNQSDPKINFLHWFAENKERLLQVEKEQMIDFGKDINESAGFPFDETLIEHHYNDKYGELNQYKPIKKVCPTCETEHTEVDCNGYCSASCLQENK